MKMIAKSPFYRLALEANERQASIRNDVLPAPTLDERVSLYLRAVHGNREFTEEQRSNARDVLLKSMVAEIAAQSAEQNPEDILGREKVPGADRKSFLARHSGPLDSVEAQESSIEPGVTWPLPPHPYEIATRKEATRGALIARHRTILAVTATFGLALIVTGGTLEYYRWYTDVTGFERGGGETQLNKTVPPPTASPRSLSTRPAPNKAAPERYVVQIVSQRSEADVLAVFRRLQQEQPQLLGHMTLNGIDLGLQSYTAQVGPFASEKDAAAVCRAFEAADIQCLSQ